MYGELKEGVIACAGAGDAKPPLMNPADGAAGGTCGFWNVFPVGRDANPFPAGEKGANPPLVNPGEGVTGEVPGFRDESSTGRGMNAFPAAGEKKPNPPVLNPGDAVAGEVSGFRNEFPAGRDAKPTPAAGEGAKSSGRPESAPSGESCISGADCIPWSVHGVMVNEAEDTTVTSRHNTIARLRLNVENFDIITHLRIAFQEHA